MIAASRSGARQPLSYRRFATAAEAIRGYFGIVQPMSTIPLEATFTATT